MPDTAENADELLNAALLNPCETSFLFGAGISMPAPTKIPTVFAFYDRLMQIAGIRTELIEVIWEKIRTIRPQPRFEVFIHQFQKIDTALEFANIFNAKAFNSNHSFISRSINNGAIGITTNFDECVELSGLTDGLVVAYDGQDLNKPYLGSALYKPHGTISLNKQHLVVTDEALSRTNNGFAALPNWRTTLLNAINDRVLVVVGYSGSDDFDIMPILKSSNQKRVIWIRHDSSRLARGDINGIGDRIEQSLAGKHVTTLIGNFEDYVQRHHGTWKSLTENDIRLDNVLSSILNNASKKAAVERLLLRHFCCYTELLNAATSKPIHANGKDHAYALFKLSRFKECIEYGQHIKFGDLTSADDWQLIHYYVTSSLILVGRYAEALDRIRTEDLNPRRINDFRLLCDWHNLYASAKYIAGDFETAKIQYEIAQTRSREVGYLEGFATASWGIGDILAVQQAYSSSLSYYLGALATAEALGKNSHCVTINRNIAEVYIDTGQYWEARKYANLADALLPAIDQRYNDFYLLFTKLKLSIIECDEVEFANICKRLLTLVHDGIATAILIELLVLLVVAYIDRGYSYKKSMYFDFLAVAIDQVDNAHFLKAVGDPKLLDLIYHPELYSNFPEELIASFRSIVLHSTEYLTLRPTGSAHKIA